MLGKKLKNLRYKGFVGNRKIENGGKPLDKQ